MPSPSYPKPTDPAAPKPATPFKARRGFAAMDPAKRAAISSMGGKAAQSRGKGHRYTHHEAIAAGRKGGLTISQDRAHMARIALLGGEARRRKAIESRKQVLPEGSYQGTVEGFHKFVSEQGGEHTKIEMRVEVNPHVDTSGTHEDSGID